ncbi:MAG: XRE family transcriptional regulator [Sphingobacteriales bacterium]|nr:MAG: XRE family transcriptional regulator [Sphingobacteriales bacterium]
MKTRKKLQLLQGITAIRVKAGITQLALAQWLGISKSLVSMVENNRRKLPLKALLKLAELEIQLEQQPACEMPLQLATNTKPALEAKRQLQQSIKQSQLEQLAYRLKANLQLQASTLASLQYLDSMQQTSIGLPVEIFEWEKQKLLNRLKRCDETACAKIEGKMMMLEIVLESYRTDNEMKATMQAATHPYKISYWQKSVNDVAGEIIVGNACNSAGVEAAA